ncbi:MAG: carbohydrate ABC transporter permease [Chloroflexi bacterium]|nr:carbohydrate ABC transporter permease [Chloroflexota bacterium]
MDTTQELGSYTVGRGRVVTGASRRQRILSALGFHAVMMIGALIICVPLIWMVSSSLKAPNRLFSVPIEWIPYEFRWQNYVEAWNRAQFARYFFNSIYTSVATTLLNLFFCSLVGYGFAKYRFPGRNVLFLLILATMMIPFHVVIVPLFILMRDLGWLKGASVYNALIIPGMMSAFGIFLMRQFIQTLPDELFDAARIDGASEIGTYLRIVLPLSKGPLAALAVFIFLDTWNSLLWPLVLTTTNDDYRTVAVGLTTFQTVHGTQYHLMMAASTLVAIPMILVFFVLQKYFIRGIALSGLKG